MQSQLTSCLNDKMSKLTHALGMIPVFPAPVAFPAAKVKIVSKQNILLGDEGIKAVHASTVLPLSDGSVLAAWFGGTQEKNSDVRIWFSLRDEYGCWSRPQSIYSAREIAHWNPVLYKRTDGSIRLFYKVGVDVPDWQTWYCDSFDGGKSFNAPRELVEGDVSGGRGPVKNKCLRTKDGLLLAPASCEQNKDWRVFIDVSRDDGDTWQRTDFIDMRDPDGRHVRCIQPTLWQDNDGNLHFLCRTSLAGYIYKSDSFDGGLTWIKGYKTRVHNDNSGIDCVRSDDGRIWLLCSPVSGEYFRSPLRLLVSKDNGSSWRSVVDFERYPHGEYSYPAITCKGKQLYCTYTNKRENITFVQLEIED